MRSFALLSAAACALCLGMTFAAAQGIEFGQADEQIPPYHTHQDRRHGHDHVYPDRGSIVRDLPHGAAVINYAGISYRFAGGVWYEPRGPAYIVVEPPIGLVVPALPGFATGVHSHGKTYLYANDTYYRARPDLGGYEVVNDPADTFAGAPRIAGGHAPRVVDGPRDVSSAAGSGAEATSGSATPGSPASVPTGSDSVASSPPPKITPLAAPSALPSPTPASGTVAAPTARTQAPPESHRIVRNTAPSAAPLRADPSPSASTSSGATRVMVLAEKGQSPDEQARDRYACYRFAVAQSGFDPLGSDGGAASDDAAQRQDDYARAQAACLEVRGYRLR